MPFATVAIPFDAYAALPSAQHRWLLMCLARYADKQGRCWPSMRQLARDSRMSLASTCRYLKSMADLGVFQRDRRGAGRYRYRIADAYCPNWQGRKRNTQVREDGARMEHRVSPAGTYKVNPTKHKDSQSNPIAADPPLSPSERAERVQRLDAVLAGIMRGAKPREPGGPIWRTSLF